MNATQTQPPAAGQAAHTPTLELDEKSGCLFICRGGARIFLASITGEFSPNQNDLGALYWSDLEADSNGAARRLVAQLIRACNSHAALVAALEQNTHFLSMIPELLRDSPHVGKIQYVEEQLAENRATLKQVK